MTSEILTVPPFCLLHAVSPANEEMLYCIPPITCKFRNASLDFLAAHLAESQVAQLYRLGSSHTHSVTPADSWENQSVLMLGH